MLRKLRVSFASALLLAVAACSPPESTAPGKSAAVTSGDEAVAIARTIWTQAGLPDRPIQAEREGDNWIVQRKWKEGDPAEEAMIIDARTGKAERSTVSVTTMILHAK